jgi:hypothetical protein
MTAIVAVVVVLLVLLGFAAVIALKAAGFSPVLFFAVVLPVTVGVIFLAVIFMGLLYGGDAVFSVIRPQKEYRKWARSRMQQHRRERREARTAPTIPAPGGNDALRDPEFELLVHSGDLDAAERYLEEALDRVRGGDPARLAVYTHYLEYLLRLRRPVA